MCSLVWPVSWGCHEVDPYDVKPLTVHLLYPGPFLRNRLSIPFGLVLNQIPEALGYVRQALQLQGDDANSLHLLALLLSAQKHYHDALNIIDMALSEYPENFM